MYGQTLDRYGNFSLYMSFLFFMHLPFYVTSFIGFSKAEIFNEIKSLQGREEIAGLQGL